MSKNAVAKKESTELTPIEGYESTVACETSSRDPLLNFNGKMGHYEISLGDETTKELKVVILRGKDSRVHFKLPFDEVPAGEKPEVDCRSKDGRLAENGDDCRACEKALWIDSVKPECPANCDLKVVINGTKYDITIRGVGNGPIRKYLDKVEKVIDRPIFSVITTLGVQKHKSNKCFEPTFEATDALNEKDTAVYAAMADDIKEQFGSQAPEEAEKKTVKAVGKDGERPEGFDDNVPL